MKIRYISDLHLEFLKGRSFPILKKYSEDVCILAGDIGNPYKENYHLFCNHISKEFKKTFIIAGNHEYYNNDIEETNIYLSNYFKDYKNISFLNNSFEIYKDHCFIGTTLWSKIYLKDYVVNDIRMIKNFDIEKYNDLHQKSLKFINETIVNKDNIVMITHHGPSFHLADVKYKDSLYNQCFYSNLDDLIKENNKKIKYWVYGHTHTPLVKKLYDINFVCNPVGYPGENDIVDYNTYFTI
jgi:predicted phosphodiesterase